jgi:hypothetical protein
MRSARNISGRRLRAGGLIAGSFLLLGMMVGEAAAQYVVRPFGFGGYYGGRVILPPVPRRPVGLHPADIFEDLEARGFRNLTLSARREDVFVIDAIAPRNEPVRLVVDRYDGEILERFSRRTDTVRRFDPEDSFAPLPENRRRDTEKGKDAEKGTRKSGRVAEIPAPPRRPSEPETTVTPDTGARPTPVAPARDPSLWAPTVPRG